MQTSDGLDLIADLAVTGDVAGGVVVCHPHPQYGGNRHDAVVGATCEALGALGLAWLRFDFRTEHDGGRAERLDVIAALDALAQAIPDRPLAVAGYSFGAAVALSTADWRIGAIAAIAPPLALHPRPPRPVVPTLVLCPRHDQFSPPERTEPIVDGWPDATFEVVESADHFLHGRRGVVAERAAAWIAERTAAG